MRKLVDQIPYDQFLKNKVRLAHNEGFDLDASLINPALKPHNKLMVQWLVRGGRKACFAAFGLHKTVTQLEAVRCTLLFTGGRGLIICPLSVRQEFVRDAVELLKWETPPKFIRRIEEADETGIYLTNYESVRDGKLDPRLFNVASLDEASVLRGFGGTKTFREFMRLFTGDAGPLGDRRGTQCVPFRFVATATPSPNDYIELLAYADFLGVMDVSQAKTRFFKRDSTKADKLTLHKHKEEEFWLWVASWALFVQKPSDITGNPADDAGYILPELDIEWREIPSDHKAAGTERNGQYKLLRSNAIGVQESAKEKRDSIPGRLNALRDILYLIKETPFSHDGGTTPISEGVLREEQRATASEATAAEQKALPGEQGVSCDQKQKVGAGESRSYVGSSVEQSIDSQGKGVSQKALSTEHRKKFAGCPTQQVDTEVQDYAGGLQPHSEGTERSMSDLRPIPQGSGSEAEGEFSNRPLPQNGGGEGTSLPSLQCWTGTISRQSADASTSNRLPEQVIIWCNLNTEQKSIVSLLGDCGISHVSLTGSEDVDLRDVKLTTWKDNLVDGFISKPSMYGAGVNMQQCRYMIFFGVDYKFQDIIQAVHRVHRFGQKKRCKIFILYTEAERVIRKQLERKWNQHNKLVQTMTDIIKEHGLSHAAMAQALTRKLGVDRIEITGRNYRLVNNDNVLETRKLEANSIGLMLTSVPFSTQYEYSPNYADFGHTANNDEFFQQMDYLTPELFRSLIPGRLAVVHVKDRIVPGGMTGLGFQTVYPFHSRCIDHYVRHGFGYMGMKTIVTDVVRENNQTYRLGWTEQCKDGSKMGVGMPEYLLIFRKPPSDTSNAYADIPVLKDKPLQLLGDGTTRRFINKTPEPIVPGTGYSRSKWQIDAHGYTRSDGNRLLNPDEIASLKHDQIFQAFKGWTLNNVYNFDHHIKISEELERIGKLPTSFMLLQPQSWSDEVWTDVTRMLTLNGSQWSKGKEMHLCPMQFDIADRVIHQMSNPGDIVFDPFGGLMTVPYRAVLQDRFGLGFELNPTYFLDGAAYCKAAEQKINTPTLFDTLPEFSQTQSA